MQPYSGDPTPSFALKIDLLKIQTYKTAVQNQTITDSQLQALGSATTTAANQAEADGVTAAIDAWIVANQSMLAAQYPTKTAELAFLVKYGIHYVMQAAGVQLAGGPTTYTADTLPRINGASLIGVSYGHPRLLLADCRTAGIVAGALGLFGTIATTYGGAIPILASFGGGALVVGAAIVLGIAIYCIT